MSDKPKFVGDVHRAYIDMMIKLHPDQREELEKQYIINKQKIDAQVQSNLKRLFPEEMDTTDGS